MDEQQGIQLVDQFQHLPDGRVGAHVVVVDPVSHPHVQDVVLIYVQVGDQWLIDEIHVDNQSQATPATPEPILAVAPGTPVTSAGLDVQLAPETVAVGPNRVIVKVADPRGNPVRGAIVTMTAKPGGTGTGASSASGFEVDAGRYAVDVVLGESGSWRVEVQIAANGGPPATFIFVVQVP